MESDPGSARARAYDIVLNGTELGGGSIRIHRKDIQEKVFTMLGISGESAKEKFGFLLSALLTGEDSIRDTIAFPKTQKGADLLSGSPSPVAQKQLDEIYIKTNLPP